jgi:hypothetical protein
VKPEAILTAIAVGFAVTRDAHLMGATVFVATPLWLLSLGFYERRVLKELHSHDLL